MGQWLTAQQPPSDAATVVDQWWPQFKTALTHKVQELNGLCRQQQQATPTAQQHATASAALHNAHQHLSQCSQPQVPLALDALMVARQQLATLQAAAEAQARSRRRQQWVHNGERPGLLMSRILKPPKAASFIHGLTAPGSGHLVVNGLSLANIVASRYAATTAAAQVQPAAQQVVLQALQQFSTPLSAAATTTLGDSTVSSQEVATAIGGLAPGKAPGLDGIPGELFRRFRAQFAVILAALYSAIGALGRVPAGFLDGVIVPVLKPNGVPKDVDCYRPLQLLNYDYRLLAKILANRLASVAASIIAPAQCAFVPNRSIGDSIRLLQLLAPMLRQDQQSAVIAFLDFKKAYDTVDREFLCSVASTLGVGVGFVSWMRVLMTSTCSCALVNGFKSAFYPTAAGVRQGCPLAPFLYLFAGQALYSHMQATGVGTQVASTHVTAAQYADDIEPVFPDVAVVPAFVSDMQTFGDASGQYLQLSKCSLLPVGVVPPATLQLPPQAGLRLVQSATSLGVTFHSDGSIGMCWHQRMQHVKQRMQRITCIPSLSAFGRAFAVNAYALSTLLYGAQYASSLHAEHAASLVQWSAAVVDANLGPEDDMRRPPGIPTASTAVYNAALSAGQPPPVCTDASIQLARDQLSTHLGWLFGTRKVLLAELTVAVATSLQTLRSVVDIQQRHKQCLQRVRILDHLPANATLPVVADVLKRWWDVRVANNYKEAAWKLPLNAFPTAARMQLHSNHCVACGVLAPDVSHHFWSCPVAVSVRREIEQQLVAFAILPAGANLTSAQIWLGCTPSEDRLHSLIWDMVCIAAVHAMDRGRATAWAVAPSLATPVLINQVAGRAAVGAFWSALADFAATSYVPRSARTVLLTQQPFLAWHVVLSQGNGLRLVRH
eukprot:gene15378-biopygen16628